MLCNFHGRIMKTALPRTSAIVSAMFVGGILVVSSLSGCGGSDADKQKFMSMGTAPVGGAFPVVGGEIAELLNNNKGDNNWKVQAKGTKGSQENIRRLDKGELVLALSNSAISYFAYEGKSGWEKKFDIRAIATLAPNVAMFITKADSGIKSIADLKDKSVVVGPAGAGFEMFVAPIVDAHGISFDELDKKNSTQSAAVDMLGDGSAAAAFLGGAVPTGSITQACSTFDIYFIPFDETVRAGLIAEFPFFQDITIPKDKYSDLTGDYNGLNVGSMHLITTAKQDEEEIYQITKTIWEKRASINHPAGKSINEKNVARFTGTPFHPGAIRFYKEIGIWKDPSNAAKSTAPAKTKTAE